MRLSQVEAKWVARFEEAHARLGGEAREAWYALPGLSALHLEGARAEILRRYPGANMSYRDERQAAPAALAPS